MNLIELKGIGPKKAQDFERLGILSVRDLLMYFPRAYADYSFTTRISELSEGERKAVHLTFTTEPSIFFYKGMSIVSIKATSTEDSKEVISIKWYNQPYRKTQIHMGDTKYVCGLFDSKKGKCIINPNLYDELPGFIPEYPLVSGVTQRMIRDAVKAAFEITTEMPMECYSESFLNKHHLCRKEDAIRKLHFPNSVSELQDGRKRIVFENLLEYLIAVEINREERNRKNGISFLTDHILETFAEKLPFSMTNAQMKACFDIQEDMQKQIPMSRLIQGDVGSGKTVVAAYALLVAYKNNKQAVLLAPTSILASQHYETLKKLFKQDVFLIIGNMKKTEREEILRTVEAGKPCIITGTHALFQEDIHFSNLGLVVTDEQHRFGVKQRARMEQKGVHPDVLVMSATPIPRTLAMLLYGDLDVSILDEMPPGRKKIITSYVGKDKRIDMMRYIVSEAGMGNQTYIVCPFVEPSEMINAYSATELFEELSSKYDHIRFGLLHGKMKKEEKDMVMDEFRLGRIQILITTTVIEVGVDVKNANIIVIEGAERFGLAQIHQLRGRVGRGDKQAYCFLMSDSYSKSAKERFKVLTESSDGFQIAEKDLEQRGPGEFFGVNQHGEGEAELFKSATSIELIQEVKETAREIVEFPTPENNSILEQALCRLNEKKTEIAMN